MTRRKAICSSFPRSARAHDEKYNIGRKQQDFSEVIEKQKSYSLSLESFTQGNRPIILFPSSLFKIVATKWEPQKKQKNAYH